MKEKILIVADSHGNWTKLNTIISAESPFSAIIHCGDGVSDLFHAAVPAGVRVIRVMGNVDVGRCFDLERTLFVEVAGETVMVTHGDLYGVRSGLDEIIREARSNGASRIFFGHTHVKLLSGRNPILFNPGASSNGNYGIVTVDEKGWKFFHRSLEL